MYRVLWCSPKGAARSEPIHSQAPSHTPSPSKVLLRSCASAAAPAGRQASSSERIWRPVSNAVGDADWGQEEALEDGDDDVADAVSAAAHRDAQRLAQLVGPNAQQLNEFQALWRAYARELQLGKVTIARVVARVEQGLLPCDAAVLRTRALKVLALDKEVPQLKPRQLLSSSVDVLRFSARRVVSAARRLRKLLPDRDLTVTLAAVMPCLASAPAVDVLACELLELESVVCPVWGGAAVPPRLVTLWLAQRAAQYRAMDEAHKERERRRRTGHHGVVVPGPRPDPDPGGSGSMLTVAGLSAAQAWVLGLAPGQEQQLEPFSEGLTLPGIQERCEALVRLLGPEPAYVALGRAPRLLLHRLDPEACGSSFAALQGALKLAAHEAALAVQAQPRLLALTPDALTAQLSGLCIALGWPRPVVLSMCRACPTALLTQPSTTGNLWRRLQAVMTVRPAWAELVGRAKAYCLGQVLARPDPWQVVARLQYLGQHPRELPALPWERVVRMSQPAFLQRCPGFLMARMNADGGG